MNYIIAIVSLLILIAYCLGSLYYTNFPRYAVFQPSDDDYYTYYVDGGISAGNGTVDATLSSLNSTLGELLQLTLLIPQCMDGLPMEAWQFL